MKQTLKPALLLVSLITACKPPWVDFPLLEIPELPLNLLRRDSYYSSLTLDQHGLQKSKSPLPHSFLECWLPFWSLGNYLTSASQVFYQQNGIIIDPPQRMCSDQHLSAHCTLVTVITNSSNSSDSSHISIGIITHNSISGQILHSLPCSGAWSKSLRIRVNFVFNTLKSGKESGSKRGGGRWGDLARCQSSGVCWHLDDKRWQPDWGVLS